MLLPDIGHILVIVMAAYGSICGVVYPALYPILFTDMSFVSLPSPFLFIVPLLPGHPSKNVRTRGLPEKTLSAQIPLTAVQQPQCSPPPTSPPPFPFPISREMKISATFQITSSDPNSDPVTIGSQSWDLDIPIDWTQLVRPYKIDPRVRGRKYVQEQVRLAGLFEHMGLPYGDGTMVADWEDDELKDRKTIMKVYASEGRDLLDALLVSRQYQHIRGDLSTSAGRKEGSNDGRRRGPILDGKEVQIWSMEDLADVILESRRQWFQWLREHRWRRMLARRESVKAWMPSVEGIYGAGQAISKWTLAQIGVSAGPGRTNLYYTNQRNWLSFPFTSLHRAGEVISNYTPIWLASGMGKVRRIDRHDLLDCVEFIARVDFTIALAIWYTATFGVIEALVRLGDHLMRMFNSNIFQIIFFLTGGMVLGFNYRCDNPVSLFIYMTRVILWLLNGRPKQV